MLNSTAVRRRPLRRLNIHVTAESNRGGRCHMEDYMTFKMTCNLPKPRFPHLGEQIFMGVFDGHGGKEAAKYARDRLWDILQDQPKYQQTDVKSVMEALSDAYMALHKEMEPLRATWSKHRTGDLSTAGTTASTILLRDDYMYVANVGDSTAVLAVNSSTPNQFPIKAIVLTKDHKPEDIGEILNIQELGGDVMKSKKGTLRVIWERERTNGVCEKIPFLGVSRALGDFWSFCKRTNKFTVSPKPDVSVRRIDAKVMQFVVVASDGLWNVMTPDEVVQYIWNYQQSAHIPQKNGRPDVVKALLDEALKRWASKGLPADNIAILICFVSESAASSSEPSSAPSPMKSGESLAVRSLVDPGDDADNLADIEEIFNTPDVGNSIKGSPVPPGDAAAVVKEPAKGDRDNNTAAAIEKVKATLCSHVAAVAASKECLKNGHSKAGSSTVHSLTFPVKLAETPAVTTLFSPEIDADDDLAIIEEIFNSPDIDYRAKKSPVTHDAAGKSAKGESNDNGGATALIMRDSPHPMSITDEGTGSPNAADSALPDSVSDDAIERLLKDSNDDGAIVTNGMCKETNGKPVFSDVPMQDPPTDSSTDVGAGTPSAESVQVPSLCRCATEIINEELSKDCNDNSSPDAVAEKVQVPSLRRCGTTVIVNEELSDLNDPSSSDATTEGVQVPSLHKCDTVLVKEELSKDYADSSSDVARSVEVPSLRRCDAAIVSEELSKDCGDPSSLDAVAESLESSPLPFIQDIADSTTKVTCEEPTMEGDNGGASSDAVGIAQESTFADSAAAEGPNKETDNVTGSADSGASIPGAAEIQLPYLCKCATELASEEVSKDCGDSPDAVAESLQDSALPKAVGIVQDTADSTTMVPSKEPVTEGDNGAVTSDAVEIAQESTFGDSAAAEGPYEETDNLTVSADSGAGTPGAAESVPSPHRRATVTVNVELSKDHNNSSSPDAVAESLQDCPLPNAVGALQDTAESATMVASKEPAMEGDNKAVSSDAMETVQESAFADSAASDGPFNSVAMCISDDSGAGAAESMQIPFLRRCATEIVNEGISKGYNVSNYTGAVVVHLQDPRLRKLATNDGAGNAVNTVQDNSSGCTSSPSSQSTCSSLAANGGAGLPNAVNTIQDNNSGGAGSPRCWSTCSTFADGATPLSGGTPTRFKRPRAFDFSDFSLSPKRLKFGTSLPTANGVYESPVDLKEGTKDLASRKRCNSDVLSDDMVSQKRWKGLDSTSCPVICAGKNLLKVMEETEMEDSGVHSDEAEAMDMACITGQSEDQSMSISS